MLMCGTAGSCSGGRCGVAEQAGDDDAEPLRDVGGDGVAEAHGLFGLVAVDEVAVGEALGASVLAGLEHPEPALVDVDDAGGEQSGRVVGGEGVQRLVGGLGLASAVGDDQPQVGAATTPGMGSVTGLVMCAMPR